MSNQMATNTNESTKETIPGTLDSAVTQNPELPGASYKPYAKEPAAVEPYRPYTEESGPSEAPYEPYKGI